MMEEMYPDLQGKEDLRIYDDSEQHCKEVEEKDKEDRGRVRALRWEVYMKEKDQLIKRGFLVVVPHMKWGVVVWNCVNDNVVG